MSNEEKILQVLQEIESLLKAQLVIELYKSGINQGEIAKRLHVATKEVNDLLKGIGKSKTQG